MQSIARRTLCLCATLALTGCTALSSPTPDTDPESARAVESDSPAPAAEPGAATPTAEPSDAAQSGSASTIAGPAPRQAATGQPDSAPSTPSEAPAEKPAKPASLWTRLRAGFALPDTKHPRVGGPLEWYARHPEYINRVVERAKPFLRFILEEVEARDMPSEIALLPAVESAFRPFAYSHGRAAGIWQFIPSTGRHFDLRQTWWYDGRRDIVASTRAALDYLEELHARFDGDWLLALAAYNSGGGTVRGALRRAGDDATFWELDLPRETRGYVPKLLALKRIMADPTAYDLDLPRVTDEQRIAIVDVDSQIDLALAAELAGMTIEALYRLNPGFNRWATDPQGPHRLVVPIERAEQLRTALAQRPPDERMRWTRHRIRQGETLSHIAARYHTTVDMLRRVNELHGHMIRAGDHLVIPVAAREPSDYVLSVSQRREAMQDTEREGTKRMHVVERGDTLWDIAQRYGVGVRALAEWNGMAPGDMLHPGQRLVVWMSRRAAARTPWTTGPDHEQRVQQVRYRVRRGDSLHAIAARFNVSVAQLRSWNRVGRYLQPGQKLTLYVDVTNGG